MTFVSVMSLCDISLRKNNFLKKDKLVETVDVVS